MSYSPEVNNNTTIIENPSEFLGSFFEICFVSYSSILENKAPFALFESSDFFLVDGPIIGSKISQYFIVISKNNMKIDGFITSENKPKRIEKIKTVLNKMKTIVGKDGRKFYDALLWDISKRSKEQYVFDANFYDFDEIEDERFIDEGIVRQKLNECKLYVKIT